MKRFRLSFFSPTSLWLTNHEQFKSEYRINGIAELVAFADFIAKDGADVGNPQPSRTQQSDPTESQKS